MSNKRIDLRALRRQVPLKALSHVHPILLLQVAVGFSQVLNGSAAQPEAVARALILDGQQRLRVLRQAAPHLDLSLSRLLGRICSSERSEDHLSDEESAVQAMLEMCLGLMIRWLSKKDDQSYSHPPDAGIGLLFPSELLLHPCLAFPHLLFKARSCPTS
ncbi:MAG: hypothetical protein PVJ55_03220 [Anaerolineae bacterium]